MRNIISHFLFLSVALLFSLESNATPFDTVEKKIIKITNAESFDVTVSAHHIESGKSFSINGDKKSLMASVYKLPIAIAMLKQVEKKKLLLSKKIKIKKSDIRGGYKGPIARNYPNGGVELSLSTLLSYMVSNSDNSASDLILKEIGGPKVATKILRDLSFNDISIDRYEKELIKGSNINVNGKRDTASPNSLVRIIKGLYEGKVLTKKHRKLLIDLMTNPKTPGHIAKGLPKKTSQFHKSGWCSKNKCINDVALITLPNKQGHLALAVLIFGDIKDTKRASDTIGKISGIAFNAAVESF